MAFINSVRKRSSILVGIVTVGLILFLLGGDLLRLRSVFSGKRHTDVGTIAGQHISAQAYQAQVEQLRRMLPGNMGGAMDAFVREQAWKQLITQTTLKKASAALGLVVSDDELVDMVQGSHIHPQLQSYFQDQKTKKFDKQLLINYLQSLPQMPPQQQAQWRYFENQLAASRKQEKLMQLLQQSVWSTDLEAQAKRQAAQDTANIKYLYIPYYSCPDEQAPITDSMLQKYLQSHKNAYQVEENRSIKYVVLPVEPTELDRQAFLRELKTLKKGFTQTKDAAAFAKVNTDGHPTSARLQLTAQQLPETLARQKAQLRKGRVIGAVQEGDVHKLYRIINLPNQSRKHYEVAVIEKQLVAGDEARDQSFRQADYCASTVQDAAQLAAYAEQNKLTLQDAKVRTNDMRVGKLSEARELVRWLYNDAKMGQVSRVFEIGDAYVVAAMTKHIPAGTAPLAQVRDEIALQVRNEQKATIIMEKLQQTADTTLEDKVAAYGAPAQLLKVEELCFEDDTLESAGMARRAIGTAFALKPGAQATVADDNGVIVVELVAKNKPEPGEDLKTQKQNLQKLAKSTQLYTALEALEELAKVKDNRYRFY
ncbi:MAG: SurA N-terminal domain-containing protein [Bacteroidota bacterium]